MSAHNGGTSPSVFWLGLITSTSIVVLELAYAIALILGLSQLESANDPIGDPYFTIMELLIIAMMPAFLVLAVSVYVSCGSQKKHYALAATVFATALAVVTTSVHSSILLLSREPEFEGLEQVFSFEWPSVVYVLDVLAWDFFFGFFAVFLALSFERTGMELWIGLLLLLSGFLAFAGLVGATVGDMSIRNVGIIGYVGVFPLAAVLIAGLMLRRLRLVR